MKDMGSALKAIEADRETVLALARELDASDWTKTSGCPGWSARDVLSHMACSFWLAVDPAMLPDPQRCLPNGQPTCMWSRVAT